MQLRKTVKRIVALGIGTTMVGATILGAMAADLSQYPAPFVKDNGMFNGQIVVGEAAQTGDVLGAIDIASSLQFAAKVEVPVSSDSTETVTIENGEKISQGSDDLSLNEAFDSVKDKFDSDEFPVLMEDGTVEDDSGDGDVDYEQEVMLGDEEVTFGNPDDDFFDEATPYIDLAAATGQIAWSYVIDFDEPLDVDALDDGETITMFGKEFTFDPDNEVGDQIILFGSDKTVIVSQGETVTVTVDGKDYEISVLGGNSDDSSAIVRVGSDTKTLKEGDSRTLGGLDVYVDDVFISNIGTSQVSVNIFVGSQELELPTAADGKTTLKIDDEDYDPIEVTTVGTVDAVESFTFDVLPTELQNPDTSDDFDWLAMGKSFEENELFNFKMDFDSATPEVAGDSDSYVGLTRSGDTVRLEFTNNEGDDYTLDLFKEDTTNDEIDYDPDFVVASAGDTLTEGDVFILVEDETDTPVTKIYEVKRSDLSDDEVELKELMSGKTVKVNTGEEIEDTGVELATIPNDDDLTLDSDTLNYVYTKYDMKIEWDDIGTDTDADASVTVTFSEDANGDRSEDVSGDSSITVDLTYDSADNEIDIGSVEGYTGGQSTEDNDIEYTMTEYGTYFEDDTDSNDNLDVYVPSRDRMYNVFFAPVDAAVVRSGSSGETVYEPVKIDPGASVLDTEISNYQSKNLISVGGPAANRASAALLGVEFPAYAEASTIPENAAIIKLVENGDAVSVVVAGWEADDTRRASRVLADYNKYQAQGQLTGKEVRITGTSLTDISVQSVE